MRRYLRHISLILIALVLLSGFETVSLASELSSSEASSLDAEAAQAEDASVIYSGNTGDLIFVPGSDYSPTDLFTEYKNVVPGDTIKQTITIKNNAKEDVEIKIYLRSLGETEDSDENFLNQLQLEVKKPGNSPFFNTTADKTTGLEEWKEIGILYYGGATDLELTLTVPTSLGNEYTHLTGKIKWQFMAIEIPVTETYWVCGKCGNHNYRVIDYKDHSEYLCEDCGYSEDMHCHECGGQMHRVVYKSEENKTWYYYECNDSSKHRTAPVKTGDTTDLTLWIIIGAVSLVALFVILFFLIKRKKDDEDEDQQPENAKASEKPDIKDKT